MGYMNKYEGFELSRRFPGDPPEYSVERVRRTFGADVPLITADISYPVFSAEEKTGLERINALYREMAERFLAWAENEGHEAALAAYESDPDPARRFRFRRFRICAMFEPGFCRISERRTGVSCLSAGAAETEAGLSALPATARRCILNLPPTA